MALSKWSAWTLTLAGAAVGAVAIARLYKRSAVTESERVAEAGAPRPTAPPLLARAPLSELELLAAGFLEWPVPDSVVTAPSSAREQISARPRAAEDYRGMIDDYDTIDPEDLGAAFLAGATDTALEPPPRSTADLSGFQIFDGPDAEPS